MPIKNHNEFNILSPVSKSPKTIKPKKAAKIIKHHCYIYKLCDLKPHLHNPQDM